MLRVVLLACVLGACGFRVTSGGAAGDDEPPPDQAIDTAEPTDWLPGYTYRKRIDVTSGQAVALDDFAIAIVIENDADLAAHARDDGQDLIITTADGAILEYELEQFDGATGALSMWARVPSLAPQTPLYLYYGGEIRLHDARATWSPQTYRAVWHMTDPLGTQANDSAGTNDLASTGAMNLPVLQDGIAGVGRGLDGDNDMLRVNDDDSLDFGTESFSFSVWVFIVQSSGFYDMPMYKGAASFSQPGYDLELGTGGWRAFVGDGTSNPEVTFSNETLNVWVHLVAVVDRAGDAFIAYKDGAPVDQTSIVNLDSTSSDYVFTVGSNGSNYWMRGRIDEPRIYARALPPEWIAAEHANLRAPATFAAVGAEETML
ncbi:MAG: LamG-like jellyroll fold domain-containing protein [Kofleriaceae bacterium]